MRPDEITTSYRRTLSQAHPYCPEKYEMPPPRVSPLTLTFMSRPPTTARPMGSRASVTLIQRLPRRTDTVCRSGETLISLRCTRSIVTPFSMLEPPEKGIWPPPCTVNGQFPCVKTLRMVETALVLLGATNHRGRVSTCCIDQ